MSTPPDRRSRKRLATRQGISDAATRLFLERGFDAVTVDDVAEAADVGRMTVFNHFPRKEDLFFDRDEEGREMLRAALRSRDLRVSPVETLRRLAHRLIADRSLPLRFNDGSRLYVETVERSEALKARARGIRDELAAVVAAALSDSVGRDRDDPDARLAACLLLATWAVAFVEAHRGFRRDRDGRAAEVRFLGIVDRGTFGVRAALSGTPYVEPWQEEGHPAAPNPTPARRPITSA